MRKIAEIIVLRQKINFSNTGEISIPRDIIDQVIGQEHAVDIIRKAALQRRHCMLIGEPGTGKSLLGSAMSEILPREILEDTLVIANPQNPNTPKIMSLPAGLGRERVEFELERVRKHESTRSIVSIIIPLLIIILGSIFSKGLEFFGYLGNGE